jgi:hypothetical protein
MDIKPYIDQITAAKEDNLAKVGETKPFVAYLGDGTGNGNIINTNGPYPRMVNYYYKDGAESHKPGAAILDPNVSIPCANLSSLEGIEVIIAYPPRQKVPYVVGQSRTGLQQLPGGGISPTEQALNAAGHPYKRDLQDLYAFPISGSAEATVNEGDYYDNTGVLQHFGGDNTGHARTTITARIAALTSGQEQVCWICLNVLTGMLDTAVGTVITAHGTLPSRGEFSLGSDFNITFPANVFGIVPVYLYYGETAAVDADYYRQFDKRDFPFNLASNSIILTPFDVLQGQVFG